MSYTKADKRAYILRLKQEASKKKQPKKETTSKLTESKE